MIRFTSRDQVDALAVIGRRQGKSFGELLDRHGFLLTEQRLKDIQADMLGDIADMLETTTANRWLTTEYKHPNTEDVRIGVAARLRQMEQATRQVGWRKS